jgi:Cft2 family RNA processing exonuclease
MAGFGKKIFCSVATAQLIPLVLEDALKIGFTQDTKLIDSFLRKVETLLMPLSLYVQNDKKKYTIAAGVETISGYSAHAGQDNLLHFIKGIRKKPSLIRLVYGEPYAQEALQEKIVATFPEITVERVSQFEGESP